MSDFRLEVKVKNNRLVSAIEKDFKSVNAFCNANNLWPSEVGLLCNLKASPLVKTKNEYYQLQTEWRKIALDISEALGMLPEEIWPEHMQEIVLQNNKSSVEVNADFVAKMISSDYKKDPLLIAASAQQKNQLEAILDTLEEREKAVIFGHFGFDGKNKTLSEISEELNCSRERVRQILSKALKKLRHPTRSGLLEDFLDTEEDYTMNFENI